jgi:hypothetical protein
MYIIVNSDGGVWNWKMNGWQDELSLSDQGYREKWSAVKAKERIDNLQGFMFDKIAIEEYV